MWRKLLKYKNLAKRFYKREVGNGRSTSFWHDCWSNMGDMWSITGARGVIDLGIQQQAVIDHVTEGRRRRRHRSVLLTTIENEIEELKQRRSEEEDKGLWRLKNGQYKAKFSSRETWLQIRSQNNPVLWSKGIWFNHHTPKFAFITWLAINDRLSTGDRMKRWNNDVSDKCVLCETQSETKKHLFFSCKFSKEVWIPLVRGIMRQRFTNQWEHILPIIANPGISRIKDFILRYLFQATINHIWRERNLRRHGEQKSTPQQLVVMIDKFLRNRINSFRHKDHNYADAMVTWLESRNI